MSIILTTQPSLSDDKTLNILGDFGDAIGIPGFPQPNRDRGRKTSFQAIQSDINNVIDKLTGGSNQEQFDPSFVGDGRQAIPGGNVQGGEVSPLEEANVRQTYSQSPQTSVIIKKRAFSGLQHLYDPTLMDPAEKWLLRAIKRLTASKCEAMALYERLTKIKRLEELGMSPGLILASLISTSSEELGQIDYFTSAMQLQRAQADRQPPDITTYHVDSSFPIIEELGPGNGIFEITAISDVNTNLDINGSGSASFNIEDPYRILIVTEQDIEMALRDTALSGFVDAISSAAGLSLTTSQASDAQLQKEREANGKSAITFSVGVGSNYGVSAVIDAIGFEITEDNLDDIPEPHTLNSVEETLFKSVLTNLKNYEFAMRKNFLNGIGGVKSQESKEQIKYAREKMRLYHMGKSIIQPLDSVHIFIDGGTRRLGETGNIEDPNEKFNLATISGSLNATGNILGLQNEAQVDDDLLRIEWEREGQHMKFKHFKVLRTLQGSGEGGIQVFGGVVNNVTDKYNANSGKFILSVSCNSNMEWLSLSRFNQSPSLQQVQGIVYDPLTPFNISTDPATGLPKGKPEWSDANKKILNGEAKVYFDTGAKIGIQVKTENDAAQDIQQTGGNLVTLFQHAPGLVYRWKPGIITATYNMATTDPKDGTVVSYNQLRREIGQYSSNTPFDNMDAANVISLLVTGHPYDPVRFVQTALNSGSFSADTTYNDYKQYFHTFLDVQRSVNIVQGGFSPFKTYDINPKTFADGLKVQRQLSGSSSRLTQLRTELAELEDKFLAISKSSDKRIARALNSKIESLNESIDQIDKEISGYEKDKDEKLKGSVLFIAGNDITLDLLGNGKDYKLFGDRLRHASLRRREDIIRNRDRNYLIISDEYDKDYDIQAFVLKFKEQQSPDLWKSSWQDVLSICKSVAETLNFEIFCNSQGHIVFRPPQYNRTPASVFNNLFSMAKSSGIDVLPDFLKNLFLSREQSILREIITLETEIVLNGALLGYKTVADTQKLLSDGENTRDIFVIANFNSLSEIAGRNFAQTPQERKSLQATVSQANKNIQLSKGVRGGAFTARSQVNLQKRTFEGDLTSNTTIGNEDLYNDAREKLVRLRGTKLSSIPEYSKAKIGVSRNGQRTPSSDAANIISNISNIISRRSKLLLLLDKILEQNIQVGDMSSGKVAFTDQGLVDSNFKKLDMIYDQLVEDDTKNVLGHMSGERFVIKDEHIISATFTEKPPNMTSVSVNGTEPLVGEKGSLANIPVYTAFGTDFDLWRQYGWRTEKSFEKPFFWSAELQCAPYAVMLLSRQRKNTITGTVTLIGNEFYQLGDVVYITHRNMLYYVESVQHSFNYNGSFNTTLKLTYGHSPGEYIPTPLDVIGKGLVTKGRTHTAYRMRRDIPPEDTIIGVVDFAKNNTDLLGAQRGNRNFEELKRAASIAKRDFSNRVSESSKIYLIAYGGDKDEQNIRIGRIRSWFHSPYAPGEPSGGVGADGRGDVVNTNNINTSDKNIGDYQINAAYIDSTYIRQSEEYKNLSTSEKNFLKSGLVASQKTRGIDPTLKNVIEIRLRQPPVGGWKRNS